MSKPIEERCGECWTCKEGHPKPFCMWLVSRERAMVAVLHAVAKRKCDVKHCGTVCKCDPCLARLALERYDPEWRP